MTNKTDIQRALDRVAKGDTLDASNPDFCKTVLFASFQRFAANIGVDAPSSASALNGVAVIRHKCGVPESALIEPFWIGTRLVGIAKGDPIIVDTVASASIVTGAGGLPKINTQSPAGYVLQRSSITGRIELTTGVRAAVIREIDETDADQNITGGTRIATVHLNGAYAIDLYEGGSQEVLKTITLPQINRSAGQILDTIPLRHPNVRRGQKIDAEAVSISYTHPSPASTQTVSDIYDTYRPEATHTDLTKPHPAPLIQSKTLAGSRPEPPTYQPILNQNVLVSGAISDCQFETLVLAGQTHEKRLAFDDNLGGEPRLGFYVADGTGAGKTNTVIGIILNNWNQGRKRHIIIGEKQRHRDGFVKAMQMLGMTADKMINLTDYQQNTKLPNRDGVIFLTYSLLRQVDGNGRYNRVRQLVEWAGSDFDGVIAMDESQNMRNGTMMSDEAGWGTAASQQAIAGIKLQNELLNARVVYSSATGSTVLENLSYMVRMGMWGPGTPYVNGDAFYEGMASSGLSGLEAISCHMKANSQMVCRQLSLHGVVYEQLLHTMSPDDIALYDAYCAALYDMTRIAQYCAKNALVPPSGQAVTPGSWRNIKKSGDGQNYAAAFGALSKRLIDTLIVSIKCQTMIEDIHRALDRGEACVIQIQSTYEAELNRMLNQGKGIDTNQLQATSELIRFVNSLPEYRINYKGDYVLDRDRTPVHIPENGEAKRHLIEKIQALPPFVRPLESIFGHFGYGRVAEITGRTHRVVPENSLGSQGDPNPRLIVQEPNENTVRADHRAFMNDQKQILVFSNDAGGTGMDYHASLSARNQRLRRHYVLQLGHRADQAIQGPGRSHRTYQRQPPVIVYMSLDIPAEKVYLSNVISKMASLGALSQGHRSASTNGMFSALDTYQTTHANSGWQVFVSKLRGNKYPDLKESELAVVGSLESASQPSGILGMEKFLKRAVTLSIDTQRRTFHHLDYEIQNHIMSLISEGRYDSGPETLRDPITVLSEEVIYRHPCTGARIKVSRVECDVTATLKEFDESMNTARMFAPAGEKPSVWFNEPNAEIWIEYSLGQAANGCDMVCVLRPDGQSNLPKFAVRGRRIEEITDESHAIMLWNAQTRTIAAHRTKERLILSGALPLVWTMLVQNQSYRRLLIARTESDHRILGFNTNASEIEDIKVRLSQMKMASHDEISEIQQDFLMGATINLKRRMFITPQMVDGETRQALMVGEKDLKRLRQNASALGLEMVRTNGLEFFVFSNKREDQKSSLQNLITVYGYQNTTREPNWTLLG